jgi:hypothetical protein
LTSFQDRVAAKATEVKVSRLLLSIPAAVLWLVGAAVGLVWFLLAWCWAALIIGFSDGSRRETEGD